MHRRMDSGLDRRNCYCHRKYGCARKRHVRRSSQFVSHTYAHTLPLPGWRWDQYLKIPITAQVAITMMPATGRYSTPRARQAKKICFCRTRTVVRQGRELKGQPDSHFFGKGSQSLTAKKLGCSIFSGRPGPSLCEWGAIQSQSNWFIWFISFISCSQPDKPKKPNKPDEPTEPDPRPAP